MNKSVAFSFLLIASIATLCFNWQAEAQKTIANSFQQQIGGSGTNPSSVYGDYLTSAERSDQTNLISPVQQSRSYNYRRSKSSWSQPAIQQQQVVSSSSSFEQQQQSEADAEPASYGSVSGQPGRDFPDYKQVPKTSFSCEGLPYSEYGMYADEETGCQAYHVCYNGRKDSFLCGPGTVFNQRILHCDYWYSVDCAKSSLYWSSNAYMGSSQPEPGPAEAQNVQSSYKRTEVSSTLNRPQAFRRNYSYNTQQVQEQY